jgi:hypothetical protein|tara:strand:- start:755 stop:865 length:111 start_codon:yes stop_codon:yes gene_type:complete
MLMTTLTDEKFSFFFVLLSAGLVARQGWSVLWKMRG